MSSTPIFSFGLPPAVAGLQALTIEYLEHMRCFSRQNGFDIQELFEQFDPLRTGAVPDYTFLHIIHNKFWNQIGFSIEQIRVIADLFRNTLGEVSYKNLDDWMKSDDNIIDQMLQLHCTCASLFSALVADKTSSLCSSCLISPNSRPTTATFPSTTYLGNMLTPPSTPPPPPPTYLPGFGTASIFPVQRQISTQGNCGGGEMENPVRFTLGRTDKPHVRKLRQHRDRNSTVDGSPSSPVYSFRPFAPLNTCFTGETSVPPSVVISSIFGIPEASVGEPVIQSSPLPITSASSFHTLFHTSGTPSETSTSRVGGGDRGHLAHQNPKYLPPRNYLLEFLNVRLRPTRRINSP